MNRKSNECFLDNAGSLDKQINAAGRGTRLPGAQVEIQCPHIVDTRRCVVQAVGYYRRGFREIREGEQCLKHPLQRSSEV